MPLHNASKQGHKNIVSLFFEIGANVNAQDNNGKMPLHYACTKGHKATRIILSFLEKGASANVNAKDKDQSTSFLLAGTDGCKAILSKWC